MTKYEELCAACLQSRTDITAYHNRARAFTSRLLTGFVEYLGAAADEVQCFAPEESPELSTTVSAPLTLGKDGWWVACVRLMLQGRGIFPKQPVLFKFCVFVEPDKFTVRLGNSERTHIVLEGANETALESIYQQAFDLARDYFTSGLQRFLDEAAGTNPRRIGFTAGIDLKP